MSELLRHSIARLEGGEIDAHAFVALWRETAVAEFAGLPDAYGRVLDDLLIRLESSALFDAESCSFSREDLLANLKTWLDKATARLAVIQSNQGGMT